MYSLQYNITCVYLVQKESKFYWIIWVHVWFYEEPFLQVKAIMSNHNSSGTQTDFDAIP